jgi:hypothetical protein
MTFQPLGGAGLPALLAAIKNSPILVRRAVQLILAREWASVRNSPDVDAFVLAWIASHVHSRSQLPRPFM